MAKPSKYIPLPLTALLNKYIQEEWEARLKGSHQQITERVWNPSGPKSTTKKRIINTLDGDGDLIGHVVHFIRADDSMSTMVTLLVDGDTAFYAHED